jgi:hypothetical protein
MRKCGDAANMRLAKNAARKIIGNLAGCAVPMHRDSASPDALCVILKRANIP